MADNGALGVNHTYVVLGDGLGDFEPPPVDGLRPLLAGLRHWPANAQGGAIHPRNLPPVLVGLAVEVEDVALPANGNRDFT